LLSRRRRVSRLSTIPVIEVMEMAYLWRKLRVVLAPYAKGLAEEL